MASSRTKHLTVLGLPANAKPGEIRSAYRRLAIQWHPDKNNSEDATRKFQEISHAYTALTDPDYRSDNDDEVDSSFPNEGLERFMNLFQRAFFGNHGSSNFMFADDLFFDNWDGDDHGFEPEELFPLQILETTTNSLTVDWSESRTEVPASTIYRLDISSPEKSLQWSPCYLGHGRQTKITGLLPGTEYQLRLGVADDCNETIDISSEASRVTKGARGQQRSLPHPKIHVVTGLRKGSDMDKLSYRWNMNRIDIYEKLVIDPDVEIPTDYEFFMPRRFNFGDDDDDASFEMVDESGSNDSYDQYAMYSDGEMPEDIFSRDYDGNISFFGRMNLNSNPAHGNNDGLGSMRKPKSSTLCRFFQQGACRYGNSCRFSHDPLHQKAFDCDSNESAEDCSDSDLPTERSRTRTRSMPPCRFFQAGNCKKSNCKFSHDTKQSITNNGMISGITTASIPRKSRR